MWLIVGLGNPGEEYVKTRHNIGFRAVDALADRYRLSFSEKRSKARVAEGVIAGQRVALAKPFTFMNLSGQAVTGLRQWYKVDPASELLIVYDDLDLPFGAMRLRANGSSGTHNGMRSIVSLLGSQQFPRLRLGIDRTPQGWDTANYVLSRFTREQEEQLPGILGAAADAMELIVREGMGVAMNRYNGQEKKPERGKPAPPKPQGPAGDA
ncbi:aminoacyl-tRNA hydrolase [Chloroflexia bacterium SDU3-3]|nr:aminoacyl-tRNA hydrolase [Chloroflexia bacterium SDU3-3]